MNWTRAAGPLDAIINNFRGLRIDADRGVRKPAGGESGPAASGASGGRLSTASRATIADSPTQSGIIVCHAMHEGWTQTDRQAAHAGSRLKPTSASGRPRLTGQPSSRTGENPPYGMIGGIEETSASFEARSAPRSYPTASFRRTTFRRRGDERGAQGDDTVKPRESHVNSIG